jgi:hypothetical protein
LLLLLPHQLPPPPAAAAAAALHIIILRLLPIPAATTWLHLTLLRTSSSLHGLGPHHHGWGRSHLPSGPDTALLHQRHLLHVIAQVTDGRPRANLLRLPSDSPIPGRA